MNVFRAGVQYDDFKGSVAADRADEISFLELLKKKGLANNGERLAGYRICFSGNHGEKVSKPGVVAYLYDEEKYVKSPAEIRAVEVEIPIADLFSYFKRFDLVMTQKGMQLDGVPVTGPHLD